MLRDRVAQDLAVPLSPQVGQAAAMLAQGAGTLAVLFYGSVLRTGQLDDVLDFYVLTERATGSRVRRAVSRALWPDVGWRELDVGGRIIRAKVATMPLATFAAAARGGGIDTTIWTRFAQPAAIAWTSDRHARDAAIDAVAAAITTAARFAAALGPARGPAEAFWRTLFAHTYRAEFRVERRDRSALVVAHAPTHYADLLPLGWQAAGIAFDRDGDDLQPSLPERQRRALRSAWRRRARAGKPLNVARLVKAAFTFDGAARYGAYKIERHTGVPVVLTPWRERHPVLAAPGVLWRVMRAQRS